MHSGPEPAASRYSWYVVTVLLAVYMVHHLDRMIITLLLEPIGRDFDLSDSQLGLLAGLAYAVPFAIAGLPLGMLVDRVNRVRLLTVLVTVWSGLTTLAAFATGFLDIARARRCRRRGSRWHAHERFDHIGPDTRRAPQHGTRRVLHGRCPGHDHRLFPRRNDCRRIRMARGSWSRACLACCSASSSGARCASRRVRIERSTERLRHPSAWPCA